MNETSSTAKPETTGAEAQASQEAEAPRRQLPEAAKRALAEAEARRKAAGQSDAAPEAEIGGRGGADPARFGDWEIKGRAIDF